MPTYDFVCQDCGLTYEARLSMSAYSAGEGRKCPTCGSVKAERVFTPVGGLTGSRSDGSCAERRESGACCGGGSGFS